MKLANNDIFPPPHLHPPYYSLLMMAIRRRGPELSPQLRSRLYKLRSFRLSFPRIHTVYRDIPLSTIKTICYREANRVNNQSKQRSGTPRKLSDEQRDYLYNLAVYQNPYIKNRELINKIDKTVKKRSIQRLFREIGRRK